MRDSFVPGALFAALLALPLTGCGIGDDSTFVAGDSAPSAVSVADITPTPIPGAAATAFTILGGNFLSLTTPAGTPVTVTFTATTGTPFGGGTSASASVPGTIDSNTMISGTSPTGVFAAGTTTATVSVTFPSGLSATSINPIAEFEGLDVSGFAPANVPSEIPTAFTVTGSGFAPIAGTATVRFQVAAGTPYLGDTAGFVEVPGTITSATTITGTTPFAGARTAIPSQIRITLPSTATGASGAPLMTFDPPTLTSVAPLLVDAEAPTPLTLTGTGFGPAAGAVSVSLRAVAGTPFAGGTSDNITFPGTITNATTADATTIAAGLANKQMPIVELDFPSGARATLPSPSLTLEVAPDAQDDAYSAIGNVQLVQGVTGGVIDNNDSDPDGDVITVVAFDAASANGATVSVAADGSFTYDPPAGFTGNDFFTYTISDGFLMDTATVMVTVANLVWFVDEDATVAGDGRLTSPFDTLANFIAAGVDGPGDVIYLHTAATDYMGNLVLQDNQELIGGGVALTIGVTPILPAGTRPNLVESVAGYTITGALNNTIRGLNVGSSNGQGFTSSGGATISEVSVTVTSGGGGNALFFDGGVYDVTFDTVSISTASDAFRFLNGASGTIEVTGLAMVSDSARAVACDTGGMPAVTFDDLTVTAGVLGIDLGTVTSGSLTINGTFTASGQSQDAIQINGTSIDLSFPDVAISDSGDHGIDRVSHSGSLEVLGGTIDNPDDIGIHCLTCTGDFVLDSVTISETGDAAVANQDAHGVLIDDCTGDVTINLCTFEDMNDLGGGLGSDNNGIQIEADGSGTIASVEITDCIFNGTEVGTLGTTMDHAIRIELEGGTDITDVDINNCSCRDLQRGFLEVLCDVDDSGDACDIGNLNVSDNGTLVEPLESQGDVIEFRVGGASEIVNFDIVDNFIADQGTGISSGYGILVAVGQFGLGGTSTSQVTGTISGNDIDDVGDGLFDRGIELLMQDDASATVAITSNEVDGCTAEAISVRCFDDADAEVTIDFNDLGLVAANDTSGTGTALLVFTNLEATALSICVDIANNDSGGEDFVCNYGATGGSFQLLNINAGGGGSFSAAQVDTFLLSQNTGTAASVGAGTPFTECTTISVP